ncbi:Lactation elevated protein 1 [Hordeum vulgare]|nr:Lactation elevated protein 1 [Hordeum vulgare]
MHAPSPWTDLVAGHVGPAVAQASAAPARKRQGNVVVPGGNPIAPAAKARAPGANAVVRSRPAAEKVTKAAGVKRKRILAPSSSQSIPERDALAMPFNGVAPPQASQRSKNYTILEDQALIQAWSAVSLDVYMGTSQTAKRYWQRIEDQYFRIMAKYPNRTPCTFRSLEGRWENIKPMCSHWKQVRNALPIGTVESDYDKIAQHRYKDMEISEGKFFKLEHCWELLQKCEKWKLIDKESLLLAEENKIMSMNRDDMDDLTKT